MRVLQLIDSLHAGGAERVAVNYANSLSQYIEGSYLCTTRDEGILKENILDAVSYLFVNKRSALDVKAIKKLNRFIRVNKINVIHAHSTSFFMATIIKLFIPGVKLIWHDHYGKSEYLDKRPKFVLKWCSRFFSHIFVVNTKLEAWVKATLYTKSVTYLPNFAIQDVTKPKTLLRGENGKRILHLANLRSQKDHITLLKAFNEIIKQHEDWTLHLVGKDFGDSYSESIKVFINNNNLKQHVFIYGSCPDIHNVLNQSTIGVLSSKSEGLPLALLEYGMAKLPVIATKVGDCNQVISNSNQGILVEPEDHKALAKSILKLIDNDDLRKKNAEHLYKKVLSSFSESESIKALINIYKHSKR
ncbi:glycosyltransferase [Tamlana sp. 2201CG12-4]|uniref:glycosyltransferase n=1 Tax=Tamlana sp. 2201CG12-4 TaxID=3112582 RepID=UPI002DC04EB2|nr:glycosyltransferase [Tamlana sp. 2201CG12-4]MEC3907357.1 glycosyltransferase [Tamlana sp. 2201CG12-4]